MRRSTGKAIIIVTVRRKLWSYRPNDEIVRQDTSCTLPSPDTAFISKDREMKQNESHGIIYSIFTCPEHGNSSSSKAITAMTPIDNRNSTVVQSLQ